MTLTVQSVLEYVRRRLDGEPSVSGVTLCNDAGRHLVSMHSWEWLIRPPANINLVAGRVEARLPDDFGGIIKIESSGALLNSVILTTPSKLLELECSTVALSGLGYWAAVIWKQAASGAVPTPTLRLYPAVSSSSTDALNIYYYAKWPEVVNDSDTIAIPAYVENLYLELVCAFARGHDEADIGSISERLMELHQSPLLLAARSYDAQGQDEMGELEGGAAIVHPWIFQSSQIVGGPS